MCSGYGVAAVHGPGAPAPGGHGVDVAVGGTGVALGPVVEVGPGVTQPPPPVVTLISVALMVVAPLYPPTTTAVPPTAVPSGNDLEFTIDGPVVHAFVTASYSNNCVLA